MFVVVLTPWNELAKMAILFLIAELITAIPPVLHYSLITASLDLSEQLAPDSIVGMQNRGGYIIFL